MILFEPGHRYDRHDHNRVVYEPNSGYQGKLSDVFKCQLLFLRVALFFSFSCQFLLTETLKS